MEKSQPLRALQLTPREKNMSADILAEKRNTVGRRKRIQMHVFLCSTSLPFLTMIPQYKSLLLKLNKNGFGLFWFFP